MRATAVACLTLVAFGMWVPAANARVRTDPNDTTSAVDIRAVGTGLSEHHVTLRVRTWDRLRAADVRAGGFEIWLDTTGDRGFDLVASTVVEHRRLMCTVYVVQPTSLVGERRAHRPNRRTVACSLPRRWVDITRTVRFRADAFERHGDQASVVDRAPDRGRYVGI
jgi:hypothetical protein